MRHINQNASGMSTVVNLVNGQVCGGNECGTAVMLRVSDELRSLDVQCPEKLSDAPQLLKPASKRQPQGERVPVQGQPRPSSWYYCTLERGIRPTAISIARIAHRHTGTRLMRQRWHNGMRPINSMRRVNPVFGNQTFGCVDSSHFCCHSC